MPAENQPNSSVPRSDASHVPWHALAAAEVVQRLESNQTAGLPESVAVSRLAELGPNQLQESPPPPWWRKLLRQFQELVIVILIVALRFGTKITALLDARSDESLLLGVFGVTLLVAGGAQSLEVSGAIGAFLVGLALSGPVAERAERLMSPLQDLFAATFFVFFSFQIDPADLFAAAGPAFALAVVTCVTKVVTGWYAGNRVGAGPRGRLRVGFTLVARGEFSIVIAALGAGLADGSELGALAAGYVLITAIAGPLFARYADKFPLPPRLAKTNRVATA